MHDDATLLRQFVEQRCQRAFTELVERHLHLVYFAALRQTDGATQLAQDATQQVFVRLAAKATGLREHPELAGWLHTTACLCAREQVRAEQRRHQRERTAYDMGDVTSSSANDEAWLRVRPLIDDALLELVEEDRAAVLLRYFESQPFAAIAATFQLSEDAARMRVDRAMDRLHSALAKRGVTSSATALATALSVPATFAVPVGLGAQIASAAFPAAAVGVTAIGIYHFMASAKAFAVVTSLTALVAVGTAIYQQSELATARAEATELRRQQAELRARLEQVEAPMVAPGAMATAAPERAVTAAAARSSLLEEPITQERVNARLRHAQQLVREGKPAEALREYLWCYDTGMPRIGSFAGVRRSFLLSYIAELGTTFPPAHAALQERRDAAEARVVANARDRDSLMDYSALNRVLQENDRSLVVFDALSRGDPRRTLLVHDLTDQLLDAKRYVELVEANPYSRMTQLFEAMADTSRLKDQSAEALGRLRRSIATSNAKNIEALAGAGDLADAREFIGKILVIDSSFETRTVLQRHLERAGHPELLPPAP